MTGALLFNFLTFFGVDFILKFTFSIMKFLKLSVFKFEILKNLIGNGVEILKNLIGSGERS